jgi:hypothetical protein
MLAGLWGKLVAGALSVSALMFSPYTGNNPQFGQLQCRAGQNYLIVRAKLESAFDNDFADVFKCGKPVHVWFKVELRHNGDIAFSNNYRHTVTYDPMNAVWELYTSENGRRELFDSYQKLLNETALLECSIARSSVWRSIEVRAEAWLQEVELSQPQRSVDLMVLWKMKRPSTRTTFQLPPVS